MVLRIQIAKMNFSPIPTESQFTKFNACQSFLLYSIWLSIYHGCNILTNQIAQREVDKTHIDLQVIYQLLSTSKWGAWVLVIHQGVGSYEINHTEGP